MFLFRQAGSHRGRLQPSDDQRGGKSLCQPPDQPSHPQERNTTMCAPSSHLTTGSPPCSPPFNEPPPHHLPIKYECIWGLLPRRQRPQLRCIPSALHNCPMNNSPEVVRAQGRASRQMFSTPPLLPISSCRFLKMKHRWTAQFFKLN